MDAKKKRGARDRRHDRLRKKVIGDSAGHTLAAASSLESGVTRGDDGKVGMSKAVGKLVGERARVAGIDQVVFDRGGNRYTGRVAALADGAREAGLQF